LSTETGRVEIVFTSDSRLLAGVAGAVNHVAEAAGMDENARAELVAAVEDACQEALKHVAKKDCNVALKVDASDGKVEAVVEYKGAIGETAGEVVKAKATAAQKLDSVRRETNGGRTRIILTKQVPR
jgi:anti-sigma regulatory factor (Ser/Thr protein kinase)